MSSDSLSSWKILIEEGKWILIPVIIGLVVVTTTVVENIRERLEPSTAQLDALEERLKEWTIDIKEAAVRDQDYKIYKLITDTIDGVVRDHAKAMDHAHDSMWAEYALRVRNNQSEMKDWVRQYVDNNCDIIIRQVIQEEYNEN